MTEHDILAELWDVISDRVENPKEGSYIASLLCDSKGIDRILEKVGEESTEYVIAVKNGNRRDIIMEAADLQFHLLVSLKAAGIEYSEILLELESRRR